MAIIRRLIAHDENVDNQWLKVDHSSRYIENDSEEWQFLFGPNSSLSTSTQVVKIAAKFNEDTFDNIQIVTYLYDTKNATIANSTDCTFTIYKISAPDWTETLVTSLNGTQLGNSYFYINPVLSTLTPVDFQGGESIMVEVSMLRLGITYRDRAYFNHLGIYDSVIRLRNEVQFLDITKKDL